jgi:hypothetical protein
MVYDVGGWRNESNFFSTPKIYHQFGDTLGTVLHVLLVYCTGARPQSIFLFLRIPCIRLSSPAQDNKYPNSPNSHR